MAVPPPPRPPETRTGGPGGMQPPSDQGSRVSGDIERIREFIDSDESQGYRAFNDTSDALIRVETVVKAAMDWAHRYEACSTDSGEAALHHAVSLLREWRYPVHAGQEGKP